VKKKRRRAPARRKKNHLHRNVFKDQGQERCQTAGTHQGLRNVQGTTNMKLKGPEMTGEEIEEVLTGDEDLIREKRDAKVLTESGQAQGIVRGHQRAKGETPHQGYYHQSQFSN
jgi:hypothetical protein